MVHLIWSALGLASSVLGVIIDPPNSAAHPLRLWQSTPGATYNDSFLIGNGRIGAAVRGPVQSENIRLNEDSFWSGGRLSRVNQDALSYMPELQYKIAAGDITSAAALAALSYAGTPVSTRHYETMGNIELAMDHGTDYASYERWLDLSDSSAGIYYKTGNTTYKREYIASQPADVIAIRIVSDPPGRVGFTAHLSRGSSALNRWEDYSQRVGNDTIVMGGGSGGRDAILFAAGLTVKSVGGSVRAIGDTVKVVGADEAWIFASAWTTFRKSDPNAAVLQTLKDASGLTYQQVRAAHVADYQGLAGRVELSLGRSTREQKSLSTSARLARLGQQFDPELAALYFQFGRYLLISSSRAGSLPPNLQGIWSADLDPQWGAKYTVNINLRAAPLPNRF